MALGRRRMSQRHQGIYFRDSTAQRSTLLRSSGEMHAREAGQRSVASTLPAPSTLLIGRDQDVAAARERLLAPHVRLLTFTGPAGTGKTRLALAVVAGVQAEFADGIHFVDLAPIRDSPLVLTAIAQVLSVRDAEHLPLRQT